MAIPLSQEQLNTMGSGDSGALSKDQLDAMMGMGLKPDQSATVAGHANDMTMTHLKSAWSSPFPGNPPQDQPGQPGQSSPWHSPLPGATPTTLPQVAAGIGDNALKFVRSGIEAPLDIAKSLTGHQVDTSTTPGLSGTPQQTFQGEFASKTLPAVESGKESPLGATAKTVGGVVAGGADVLGAGEAGSFLSNPIKKVGSLLSDYATKRADKKALQQSIDAVYSSPTGKKFTQASSQVVTGNRTLSPAGVFKEQGLSPDQQAINLGTRLKDLGLGKNPVKNADTLATAFQDTETKLQSELIKNPEIPANKPALFDALNQVKSGSPEEFRIKDSQAMIDRVSHFASKVIEGADDSIGGLRTARTSFDAQAKREFPNAFKPEGTIDTKTPAGYAIQSVRDTINEHLYNTAPNGSAIQSLIGREADLFKAGQATMSKAVAGNGKKAWAQWTAANPTKAAAIIGVGGALGYHELKQVPIVGDILPTL